MEFLKDIVLPQPIEHVHLLLFMLNLVLILFIPYLGLAVGGALLSLVQYRRSRRGGGPAHGELARFAIGVPFASPGIPLFFGLVPALALLFIFAQLLQGTEAIAAGLMLFGFLSLSASVWSLHVYRKSLQVVDALGSAPPGSDGALLRAREDETAGRAGRWGTALVVLASILSVGAVSVAVNRGSWNAVQSVLGLFLHPDFWARYIQFLAIAGGMTGLGLLFFGFEWQGGGLRRIGEGGERLNRFGIRIAALSLIALPLLLLATQALLPAASLTGGIFGLAGAHLATLLFTGAFLYAYHRDGRGAYLSYAFFLFSVALVLLFTRDQIAVRNATQDHAASLSIAAERELIALRASIGAGAKPLTGLEIYDAKCSACHLFDQKKVGPPYNVAVAKYTGKKDELMKFILNPRKVDPAYPIMPSQGLKPAEADSIATYLLAKLASVKGG